MRGGKIRPCNSIPFAVALLQEGFLRSRGPTSNWSENWPEVQAKVDSPGGKLASKEVVL